MPHNGWVKAQLDTKYPKVMHIECYNENKDRLKSRWKSYLMNGFWRDANCNACGVAVQCKCSKYKVTEPNTGRCTHNA